MCYAQNNLHWGILVYLYIILLFIHPAIFKQTISLKPILDQYNTNNWLYIGRWSIAYMLHQYYTTIGCRYEANVTVGKPMLV